MKKSSRASPRDRGGPYYGLRARHYIENCVGGNLAQIIRLPPRDDSEPLLPLSSQKDSKTETQKQPKYTNVNMEVFQDGQWLPAQIIDPPAGKTADSDKHVFVTFFTSNEKDQWVDFNK